MVFKSDSQPFVLMFVSNEHLNVSILVNGDQGKVVELGSNRGNVLLKDNRFDFLIKLLIFVDGLFLLVIGYPPFMDVFNS